SLFCTPSVTRAAIDLFSSSMTFLLIFCVFFIGTTEAKHLDVDVSGKISCSVPFKYTILLNEEDTIDDDHIAFQKGPANDYTRKEWPYHLKGTAVDFWSWTPGRVEPYLLVMSNCPDAVPFEDYYISCMKLGSRGDWEPKQHHDIILSKDLKCWWSSEGTASKMRRLGNYRK
ncbi:hypothetical protein PFISCL1PPCAC_3084, partial [Pristionchus fissidentatus]